MTAPPDAPPPPPDAPPALEEGLRFSAGALRYLDAKAAAHARRRSTHFHPLRCPALARGDIFLQEPSDAGAYCALNGAPALLQVRARVAGAGRARAGALRATRARAKGWGAQGP
jgi:hypothetical protein